MKTYALYQPRSTRRAAHSPGLAIVVVVSLMALLMLLVLAFLLTSSTNRNISSTDVALRQADSLADVAKETFIADLLGEMRDGSQNNTPNAEGTYAFGITNPRNMVPSRAISNSIPNDPRYRSIIKQSADGILTQNLGRNGVQRASNVSTNQPDLDGRFVAPERWSAPKFLAPGDNLTASQVPDWIYTTRSGTNPTRFAQNNSQSVDSTGGLNPDYIIGRYAYQVYDVSGLLDANVVGNDSTPPPLGVLNRKGSLVWADLNSLPNFSGNPSALGDWRRISSRNWPRGISASSVEEFIREWGQVSGWMKNPVSSNNSDNLFLTRKDLIAYQKANPNVIPETALPFLTTTTRALNSPSWAPSFDAGNGFQYLANQDNPNASNRRIAGVLVNRAFTRRDGTQALPGEPLVKSRFPLSKLRAFEAPQNVADIQNYFGLRTVNGSGSSTYDYINYGSGRRIMTLAQVAADNREPNFFELLKAGLLNGTLAVANPLPCYFQDLRRDSDEDYQILRVGACIIDQWDANDDPTIIQYQIGGIPHPSGIRVDDVAGVENLPYFHFLTEARFRRKDSPAPGGDPVACTFINFQLWNPHRNPAIGKFSSGAIRIAYAGTSSMRWHTSSSALEAGYTPYIRLSPPRTSALDTDYIQFNTGSGISSFSTPVYLQPGIAGATSSRAFDTISTGGAPVIGFQVGEINAPYVDGQHGARYSDNGLFSNYSPSMIFALQRNVGGQWINYQIIADWSGTHGFVIGSLQPNSASFYALAGRYANLHGMLADPRSTRHGIFTTTNAQLAINRTFGADSSGQPLRYNTRMSFPAGWTHPGGKSPSQYESNVGGGPTVTVDRDGRRRPADGGRPFTIPDQRPEILNRPFQSVVEMGLAFRDQPWKSLNFFGDNADPTTIGDGALLDLFTLTEPTQGAQKALRSGVINPNTAPAEVIKTLLSQSAVHIDGAALSANQAGTYATAIRNYLDANPMVSLGDIATVTARVAGNGVTGALNNKGNEVIGRSLVDSSSVRTWNFLVDVIAQSGKMAASANNLQNFINQGERRCWYNIAIDRITGEILNVTREVVNE